MTLAAAKRTVHDVFDVAFKTSVGLCVWFLVQLVGEVKEVHKDLEAALRVQGVHQVMIETHSTMLRAQAKRIDALQNVVTTD